MFQMIEIWIHNWTSTPLMIIFVAINCNYWRQSRLKCLINIFQPLLDAIFIYSIFLRRSSFRIITNLWVRNRKRPLLREMITFCFEINVSDGLQVHFTFSTIRKEVIWLIMKITLLNSVILNTEYLRFVQTDHTNYFVIAVPRFEDRSLCVVKINNYFFNSHK